MPDPISSVEPRPSGPLRDEASPGALADAIVRDLSPVSVLVVGAGADGLAEALRDRRVEASVLDSPDVGPGEDQDLVVCAGTPEQPPEDWAAALAAHGFFRALEHDPFDDSSEVAIFSRTEALAETVRHYERDWWWQRRTSTELRRELIGCEEEVLRLRDLLIGRDAELGAVRGRLKMNEEHAKRVAGLAARIPIPGATLLVEGFLRLLQGRRG